MNKHVLTLCAAVLFSFGLSAQIFTEDFESGIPADWTADNIWQAGTAGSMSSQYFPIIEHGNFVGVNDDAVGAGGLSVGSLTSPVIDLTGVTAPGVSMSFEAYFWDADYQGADEIASVSASSDGGATWTQIYLLTGDQEWISHTVNLTDFIGGQVMVRFNYDDSGGWQYGFCLDDIAVTALKEYDISVARIPNDPFILTGNDLPLSCEVTNLGAKAVTSFEASWTDGTNNFSEIVTGVNIGYGSSYTYNFPQGVSIDDPNTYNIQINIDMPNGETDEDLGNNDTNTSVAGVTESAPKTVVAEEATGTWCGWCPRGAVFMEYMAETYPDDYVGIAVHNNDPMEVDEYDTGLTSTPGFLGFPSVIMDREKVIDPSDLEAEYNLAKQKLTPVLAEQNVSLDEASRTLTIESMATFNTNLSSHDIRFNVVIIEDHVTGTGPGYNQANYYSGGGAGEMAGYENLGNPVPAADMVYDHVGRAILGGYVGAVNSMPASIELGNQVSHTFSYTVPAEYDLYNMYVATIVVDANSGQILNGVQTGVASLTDVEEELAISELNIFPNPARSITNVSLNLIESANVNLELIDPLGRTVSTRNYGEMNGAHIIPVSVENLSAGIYYLNIRVGENTLTKRIQVVD